MILATHVVMGALAAAAQQPVPASVTYDANDLVLSFAAAELKTFLESVSELRFSDADSEREERPDWRFVLGHDPTLPPYAFRVSSRRAPDGVQRVHLSGPDSMCVLHAVHTFLEETGYRFELSGPAPPAHADLEAVRDWAVTIRPRVNRRGIRLHMNFPQDLSSYTLEEALEWVRNAARLRFNTLVFHSYPGRLHTGTYDGKVRHAGFMYDDRLEIPDDPVFRAVIRNTRFFRIPELEPYIDDEVVRSQKTKEWCAALFTECKRVGLHVRFSFEPRLESVETTLAMCDDILTAYPMIDSLELTTNENGGGGDPAPEEMKQVIERDFSKAAYDDPILRAEFEAPPRAMVTMLEELGHNIRAVRALRRKRPAVRDLELVVGVYCIPENFGQVAIRMLHAYAPPDCQVAVMPQYGSRWVGHRFDAFEADPAVWRRLNVYSWVEFDGMFFFQQNDVDGVRHLLDVVGAASGHDPIHAVVFNTWRTAENQISIRYAAESCLYGPLSAEAFYRRYASRLGIANVKPFVRALNAIDAAVEKARDTWNIGFAWPWMWVGWWNTNLTGWDYGKLGHVCARFEEADNHLNRCLEGHAAPAGRQYLSFLQNRVRASRYHLQGLMALYEIVPITVDKDREPVDPATLTQAQREQVLEVCKSATYYTNKYMSTYAEMMPDRGCEGALIIYYYCLPELIRKLRREYGGDASAKTIPLQETDTWPEPSLRQ